MFTMAVGQSDDVDAVAAVAAAIEQCRAQLNGLQPQAGLLFVAYDSYEPSLVGRVRDAFGGIDVMGSSSSAEMSSAVGYREDSITLALFASDDVDCSIGFGPGTAEDAESAARLAVANALSHTNKDPRVCIVLAEPFSAQRAIESLRHELPDDVLIVGGASGTNDLGGGTPTIQFANDQVSNDGVAILVLSGPIAFSTAVGTGWRTLGPRGVVTRSGYGVINEIDGGPAIEWISNYLDLKTAATFGNPLAIQDPGTDSWYLRVVLTGTEEGSVAIPGSVPVGAMVQLTTTNPNEMIEASAGALERAKDAFPAGANPTAALIFSCAVRKYLLGTRTQQEVETARASLPEAMPIAGMYCVGEIAPIGASSESHFLNETFVTLLLGT